MSEVNLTSVTSTSPKNTAVKFECSRTKLESLMLDFDDDCYCSFNEDIWSSMLEQEAEKPVLHLQSPQLAFRGSLVQQLRKICKKQGLNIGTLHSAVYLLDLFMDAHRLRADRLTHVALVCLSLAAKSEEELSHAPTFKKLASLSGVNITGKTFRQLEWTVCQHVQWKLLAPTPATFATQLAQFIVADSDVTTKLPQFLRKYKKDGWKLLEEYLDLTLSDVRLKVMEAVDVGCACLACARADLGLYAWPKWLSNITGKQAATIIPVARLLQRMMKILKSRETAAGPEADQGYSSARTSPNLTPCTSPKESPLANSNDSQRENNDSFLELNDTNTTTNINYFNLPKEVDRCHLSNSVDHSYCKSRQLLEDSLLAQPSTNNAVKRPLNVDAELDKKRSRLATQISQVVL